MSLIGSDADSWRIGQPEDGLMHGLVREAQQYSSAPGGAPAIVVIDSDKAGHGGPRVLTEERGAGSKV